MDVSNTNLVYLSDEDFVKVAYTNRIVLIVVISNTKFTVPIVTPAIKL
jgi:hypothetical protein